MGWSPEQISNAKIIIQVGRQLGASDRDITIALMAGWQESGLRNLNYGDRDSIGLFQQRNAWGSRQDRLDPVKAARMFYLGGQQGQRGLLDFRNRDQWSLGQAAQKVQVSAYPDAYDKWQGESESLLKELGGSPAHPTVGTLPGLPTVDTGTPKPEGPTGSPVAPPAPSTALGLSSPTTAGTEAAGVAAKGAPGLESADEAPQFDTQPMDESAFLPLSNGQPGGVAGTFEDLFPKAGPVGGPNQRLVDIAKSYIGVPYVFGGNNPDTGLDCSSFTQLVYKQMGIDLPRISFQQANAGKRIGMDQLRVGDLVAWDNSARNNGADHVAIYIGGGQIIEEPRPGLSVRIRSLGKSDRGGWGVRLSAFDN